MNKDQARDYILRNRQYSYKNPADQLIEWANQDEFTQEQIEFLVSMPIFIYECGTCGEPILYTYDVYVDGWVKALSGREPKNTRAHLHESTDVAKVLCDHCFTQHNKLFG